jgi:hypothetical protein
MGGAAEKQMVVVGRSRAFSSAKFKIADAKPSFATAFPEIAECKPLSGT